MQLVLLIIYVGSPEHVLVLAAEAQGLAHIVVHRRGVVDDYGARIRTGE